MKKKRIKAAVLSAFLFSLMLVGLAFTPHYTCGCGQYEDGSQLTNIVNGVLETVTGKPIIETNPNPY